MVASRIWGCTVGVFKYCLPAYCFWIASTLSTGQVNQGGPCLRFLQLPFKGSQGSFKHALAAEHDRHDVLPVPDDSLPKACQTLHKEVQEEAFCQSKHAAIRPFILLMTIQYRTTAIYIPPKTESLPGLRGVTMKLCPEREK